MKARHNTAFKARKDHFSTQAPLASPLTLPTGIPGPIGINGQLDSQSNPQVLRVEDGKTQSQMEVNSPPKGVEDRFPASESNPATHPNIPPEGV